MSAAAVDSVGFPHAPPNAFGLILHFADGERITASFVDGHGDVDLSALPEAALPTTGATIEITDGSPADGVARLQLSEAQCSQLRQIVERDPASRVSRDSERTRERTSASARTAEAPAGEGLTASGPPAAFDSAKFKCKVKIGEIPTDVTGEDFDEDNLRERIADAKVACAADSKRMEEIATTELATNQALQERHRQQAAEREQERAKAAAESERKARAGEAERVREAQRAKAAHDRDVRLGLRTDCKPEVTALPTLLLGLSTGQVTANDARNCRVHLVFAHVDHSTQDGWSVVTLAVGGLDLSAAIRGMYMTGAMLTKPDVRFESVKQFSTAMGTTVMIPTFAPLPE